MSSYSSLVIVLKTFVGVEESAGNGYLVRRNKSATRIVPSVSTTQPIPRKHESSAPGTSKIKPTSVVYWTRFLMAIAAGFANSYLHISQTALGDLALIVGIALALGVYGLSVLIVRHGFHLGETQLKGKRRDVTLGGGTFIMVWVLVSVVLNTVWGH